MKKFLVIIILNFCFVISSQADDSTDFQIAGMSLKESLLDHYRLNEIKKKKSYYFYELKDYITIDLEKSDRLYDGIQANIKENDKKFIIESIEGYIFFKNFDDCKIKKESIEDEIIVQFPKLRVNKGQVTSISFDPTGNSKAIATDLFFNDEATIRIICTDWSRKFEKEKNYGDNLRVVINSKKFNQFLSKN